MARELEASDVFQGDEPVKKLVEKLDQVYPQITPSPSESIEQIMYRSGQRSVVDYLLNLIEE